MTEDLQLTELRIEPYEIMSADLGPENPLPQFRHRGRTTEIKLDESIPPEDRKHFGWQTARRILPYRMQDGYNRKKKPRAFRSVVLENEHLRATVLPELGGRLVSLYNKKLDRELLDRNPVFQPANLALRNAWFSGGIEWNTSQPGHYFLTCSPVFAAQVEGPYGEPALRIYEWDRVKRFPWQVDLILPPDSPFLFARIRIVNPHDQEIPMYWWTNMAVPERPDARTLVPAESAIYNKYAAGLALQSLPVVDGRDVTYSTNAPSAREYFFRIPEEHRRWVASLDGEGKGFFETSTARLRGRKMFAWGMHPGGRLWQRYLSEPGRAYLEIQAGLARTQLECLPMPARTHWTWTEAYGFMEADPAKVHSQDWSEAWQTAEAALDRMLPAEKLDELDRVFAEVTSRAPQKILAEGSGWGALERVRVAKQGQEDRVPSELVFDCSSLGPDQQPWLDLLEKGELPARDPQSEPGQYMVQPEWQAMLEDAAASGRGDHWLSWLHIGNMRFEAGDRDGAREAWERSVQVTRNGWALRNIAAIEIRKKHFKDGGRLLREAWEAGPKIAPLAMEVGRLLSETERHEEMVEFVAQLPDEVKANERLLMLSAKASIALGRLENINGFFEREFETIREGEVTLTELWFAYQECRVSQAEGVAIDDDLRARVRREFPPPANIDFRTHQG